MRNKICRKTGKYAINRFEIGMEIWYNKISIGIVTYIYIGRLY